MSDISKINPNNGLNVYDLKDSICRTALTVSDPTEGDGVITFGVDADGNYGYKKVGADTVTPFKSGGGGVSEFGNIINTATTELATSSYSEVLKYAQYSAKSNHTLMNNIELDSGLWLMSIPTYSEYTNLGIQILVGTEYISPISETNIRSLNYTYNHISLYKLDNSATIRYIYTPTAFRVAGTNAFPYVTFIKLQ